MELVLLPRFVCMLLLPHFDFRQKEIGWWRIRLEKVGLDSKMSFPFVNFRLHREILAVVLAGTGAFWLGTVQFALIYHPIHDIFNVHSEITTILFLSIYAVIVWAADRKNKNPLARQGEFTLHYLRENCRLLFKAEAMVRVARNMRVKIVGRVKKARRGRRRTRRKSFASTLELMERGSVHLI